MNSAKKLIEYIESFGITVNTTTKARGHHGFCKKNRIDISKNIKDEMRTQVLLHEFVHYIHSLIEPDVAKDGGTLQAIFGENSLRIFEELLSVTHWVDEASLHKKLFLHKEKVREKIKEYDKIIKNICPNFQRSKNCKDFEKVIRKTKAKYLLKYDRVKVCGWFFNRDEIFTIENLEQDFPTLKPELVAYLRLRSWQKKQRRISARINKLNKYYEKPTELFARFIEGLYVNPEKTKKLAPTVFSKFQDNNEHPFDKLKLAIITARE